VDGIIDKELAAGKYGNAISAMPSPEGAPANAAVVQGALFAPQYGKSLKQADAREAGGFDRRLLRIAALFK